MKNVQIILDSACDMQKEEADRLGVWLMPLRTSFGDTVFLDGVDLSHDEFFARLESSKTLPTTSQVPPYDYAAAYRQAADAGGEVLVITLSSKLSGTYQSAVIAARETDADVTIVDSENVTAGERVLADLAIRLRDAGLRAKEIAAELEAIEKRGGIDFSMPLMLGFSGRSDSALQEYIAASKEIWEGKLPSLPITSIGSTIGTHVGPGAIVVAFFAAE